MLPKPDIHTIQANNTTRNNQKLIILVLLNAVLLTGVFTTSMPTAVVFADSRTLKQESKQNTNCDTAGANSIVSESCNQQLTNNVNKGVPKTTGTSGVLRVTCGSSGGSSPLACPAPIQLTGNNPRPPSISCLVCIIDVTIGPGAFTVTAENTLGAPTISFSGNCRQIAPGSQEATGNIAAGQFQTCNINA